MFPPLLCCAWSLYSCLCQIICQWKSSSSNVIQYENISCGRKYKPSWIVVWKGSHNHIFWRNLPCLACVRTRKWKPLLAQVYEKTCRAQNVLVKRYKLLPLATDFPHFWNIHQLPVQMSRSGCGKMNSVQFHKGSIVAVLCRPLFEKQQIDIYRWNMGTCRCKRRTSIRNQEHWKSRPQIDTAWVIDRSLCLPSWTTSERK